MGVPEGFVQVFSDEFFEDDAARAIIDYYIINVSVKSKLFIFT